jgi:hypothetical protein
MNAPGSKFATTTESEWLDYTTFDRDDNIALAASVQVCGEGDFASDRSWFQHMCLERNRFRLNRLALQVSGRA